MAVKPRTVHLADQALAVLGAAEEPMTTREIAQAMAPPPGSQVPDVLGGPATTDDVRRALPWLERSGQVKELRRPGLPIQWEAVVVPFPVHLMPQLETETPDHD